MWHLFSLLIFRNPLVLIYVSKGDTVWEFSKETNFSFSHILGLFFSFKVFFKIDGQAEDLWQIKFQIRFISNLKTSVGIS